MKRFKRFISFLTALAIFCGYGIVCAQEPNIAVKNLITVNRGSYYSVSWTNPERSDISKTELYDVKDEKTLLASSENTSTMVTTSGSASYYAFKSDKPAWSTYVFRVEITYNNGETFAAEINSGGVYTEADGWRSDYTPNNGAPDEPIYDITGFQFWSANYPMQKIGVTTKDANSGNASLSITGNMPAGTIGYNKESEYNFGIMRPRNMNLQDGTTYKLSYYVKAADNGISGELHVQHGVTWDTKTPEQLVTTSEVPDWTKKEFTFTKSSNGNLYFMYTCANFLLDDIELYALDSDGNETGGNLITNGGFESGVTSNASPTEVENPVINKTNMTLQWSTPDECDYSSVTIYEKYGEYENPIKYNAVSGFPAEKDSNGNFKKYVIKTVNKWGKESEGKAAREYEETSGKSPKNFFTVNRGSYYSVSWTNPDRSDISKIKLYDVSDGKKLLASSDTADTMTTDGGAASYYAFKSDKSAWSTYVFRLEFTYASGDSFASEINSGSVYKEVDGWTGEGYDYAPNNGAVVEPIYIDGFKFWSNDYPMQKIGVTTKDANSGNASLSITGNMPAGTAGYNAPGYNFGIMRPENMNLQDGTTYKLSYYVKAADNGISGELHVQHGVTWDTKTPEQLVTTSEVPDWTKKEFTFTKASNGNLYFMYTCANFLLDDIELYALDSDGNKTGGNLITNGGFENGVTTERPKNVNCFSAIVSDGTTTLSWKNSGSGKLVLYKKILDEFCMIKEFVSGETEYTTDGSVGDEYMMIVYDSFENASYPITAAACEESSYINAVTEELTGYSQELAELISKCEAKNIPVDYEKVGYSVLTRFTEYFRQDYEHNIAESTMQFNLTQLENIYYETKDSLNKLLSGEKKADEVPKYVTGTTRIDGEDVFAKNSADGKEKETFFVGYITQGDEARKDISNLTDFGANTVQFEIGPYNVLTDKDSIYEWNFTKHNDYEADIDRDSSVKKSGNYSLKISSSSSFGDRYMQYEKQIAVSPNTVYSFGLSAKAASCSGAWFSLGGTTDKKSLDGTYDWKNYSYTYKTGTNENSVTLRLSLNGPIGSLNIDDVFVKKIGTTTNLVPNGGFESDGLISGDYRVSLDSIKNVQKDLRNAANNNIAASLLISPHYMPQFFYDMYPEAKSDNRIGFDITNPKVREFFAAYLEALIPRIKDYKSLNNICISNEPSFYSTGTESLMSNWHEYIADIYGNDISELNRAYGTSYTGFDQVDMPRDSSNSKNPADSKSAWSYDWICFNNYIFADFHEFLADKIHELAPDIPLHSKIMNYMFSSDYGTYRNHIFYGAEQESFSKFLDMNGSDAWEYYGSNGIHSPYLTKELWYDYQRSVKKAPVINSEDHVMLDRDENFAEGHSIMTYADIWQGAIHGRVLTNIWAWERSYNSSSDFYMNVLHRPDCIYKIGRAGLDLNRLSGEVTAIKNKKSDVAMLYSLPSRNYNESYMSSVYNTYQATVLSGKKVEFVTDSTIDKITDYRLLIIPQANNVAENTLNAINDYVNSGGKVLIVGKDSLKRDEHNILLDSAKVNNIYSKSTSLSIVNRGGYMNVPTVSNLKSTIMDKVKEANLEDAVVLNTDGSSTDNIEWQTAQYNGKTIINVCNYNWNNEKTVKVTINGKEHKAFTDLITGEKFYGSVNLYPYTPRLLQAAEENIEISDISVRNGGEITDTIGTGVHEAFAYIKNNTEEQGFNAAVVMALYQNGKLTDLSVSEKTIPKTNFADEPYRIDTKLNVPDSGKYTLKVFLLDGLNTLCPLKEAVVIK